MSHQLSKKSFSNQDGMSLVGVLAGAAAMMVVGMAVTQMIRNQSDMIFYLEDRLSAVNLKGDAQLTLSNSEACIRSLNALGFSSIAGGSTSRELPILNDGGGVVYQTGSAYDRLRIERISAEAEAVIPASTTGTVRFTIAPERTRGSIAQKLSPINIRRNVTLDGGSNVIDCQPVSPGTEAEEDPNKECMQVAQAQSIPHPDLIGADAYATAISRYKSGVTVPTTSKALTLSMNPRTVRSRVSGSSDEYSNHSIPGMTISLQFNKSFVGGKVLQAGKTLKYIDGENGSPGSWEYDGVRIATEGGVNEDGTAVENPRSPSSLQYTNLGSTCPTSDSFSEGDNGVGRILTWE